MKASIDLKKTYEIDIRDLTDKGEGIGSIDGLTVFVNGTVPGDRASVKVTTLKKNYAIGDIVEILFPSDIRVQPPCEYFGTCGGCQIQNISYKEQLRIKKQLVVDALERIGNLKDVQVEETLGMEDPYRFRNKSSFPLNSYGEMGFYKKRSHEIVPINACLIQGDIVDKLMNFIQGWIKHEKISTYDEKRHKGLLRHVVIRESKENGEVMVIFVTNSKKKESVIERLSLELAKTFPMVQSVYQNINRSKGNRILGFENIHLSGKMQIIDHIGNQAFKISPNSFFQVNNSQANKLYDKALEYADLKGEEIVFDLYCGIGSITSRLALKAKKVYGIEVVGDAIDNAEENKALNNIQNIEYILGYSEDETEELVQRGIIPDVIVVDPPRKGLETKLIDKIIDVKPDRIVYVSCKPSTMARDVAIFTQHGYTLEKVQPVDMFPHSMHVETVARLTLEFQRL
jgi:23S rRNA (uracil1939-C5)-methyltransferase